MGTYVDMRTGRCHPCKRVYRWEPREGLLRDSRCPFCHRALRQTCWLLCGPTVQDQLSNLVPLFEPGQPVFPRRIKPANTDDLAAVQS